MINYESITPDHFIANHNTKIEKNDKTLYVILKKDQMGGIIIKNVKFAQDTQYVLHIKLISPLNKSISALFFYSNDNNVYDPNNKIYLVNGNNTIHINIKQNEIIDIGFMVDNLNMEMTFGIVKMEIINKIYEIDHRIINNLIIKHFNKNVGFGEYKQTAINLLKETIQILDEFSIDYFLISGTLLGYVRHNDFIPWDDDIDLIVDKSLLDKLPEIKQKYGEMKLKFVSTSCQWIMKSHYENKIITGITTCRQKSI